jgi:hypothetical protein
MEPRALYMLGEHSSTELSPIPCNITLTGTNQECIHHWAENHSHNRFSCLCTSGYSPTHLAHPFTKEVRRGQLVTLPFPAHCNRSRIPCGQSLLSSGWRKPERMCGRRKSQVQTPTRNASHGYLICHLKFWHILAREKSHFTAAYFLGRWNLQSGFCPVYCI